MAEVTGLVEFARQLVADLRAKQARFAVVGGFAVSVRTEPRFTRDIDLAISVADDAEAEALVRGLQNAGYEVFQVLEQESAGRLATVRLRKPGTGGEPLVVVLLFASSGVEPEIVARATAETVPGLGDLPIATCGHLIALKLLSRKERGRPNDVLDLEALLRAATEADITEARAGCALIAKRGFNRGRDLAELLRKALEGIE